MLTPAAAAVFPVVILLIMTIFQGVVYYQAEQLAQAAASEGARVARLHNSSAAAGEAEARLLLAQTEGDWLLTGPAVTAEHNGQWARVAVDGTAPTFIPFVKLRIHKVVEGPVERFTPVGS
jgi:Flp pilus assembly protein TadG